MRCGAQTHTVVHRYKYDHQIPPTQCNRTLLSCTYIMEPHHCSIKDLNPYNNKRILARVLHKSEIKSWSNARGEGVLFSVLFGDETGQITAVGFGPLVQKLYPLLEKDSVYYVSRAEIRTVKDKRFAKSGNEYELQFLDTTIIEEVSYFLPCQALF